MAMMPIMAAGLSALPPTSTGAGSAWTNVGQRVAGSLGLPDSAHGQCAANSK